MKKLLNKIKIFVITIFLLIPMICGNYVYGDTFTVSPNFSGTGEPIDDCGKACISPDKAWFADIPAGGSNFRIKYQSVEQTIEEPSSSYSYFLGQCGASLSENALKEVLWSIGKYDGADGFDYDKYGTVQESGKVEYEWTEVVDNETIVHHDEEPPAGGIEYTIETETLYTWTAYEWFREETRTENKRPDLYYKNSLRNPQVLVNGNPRNVEYFYTKTGNANKPYQCFRASTYKEEARLTPPANSIEFTTSTVDYYKWQDRGEHREKSLPTGDGKIYYLKKDKVNEQGIIDSDGKKPESEDYKDLQNSSQMTDTEKRIAGRAGNYADFVYGVLRRKWWCTKFSSNK